MMDMLNTLGTLLVGLAAGCFSVAVLSDHGRSKDENTRRLWEGCDFYRFFFVWVEDLRKFVQPRIKTRTCLLYTSPSPRDRQKSRMPSSA